MANFITLVITYVLGGLTFLPLAAAVLFIHGYFFLPQPRSPCQKDQPAPASPENEPVEIDAKLLDRGQESDVAAGYFAVCREYVPGGVNGKPPERTTPAGETIAAESPSVYQSMYRSIFDRNKTQLPSLEGGKAVKKARNVFYVVLRHSHLLLFDNSEQLEVRHVIALAHYDLDLHAGVEAIPEGELYIKRNCIRLTKKKAIGDEKSPTMPFYLFSDNCSEKEDFYHALLHSQASATDTQDHSPTTQMFDTEDMIKLVRALHVADDNQNTRWLNALIGRLFLALYKTSEVEALLRAKIEKKITRVPKPTFLTSLTLENIHMGNSAPTVVNPKLKEMTVDGGLTLEADIKYNGSFRVVIAAVARIELGARFKPRTVSLVLASILKRLEGHLLIRIKPPPSNRIWISFETMPKLDVSVEPIVSSRQITYGVILRAIESRIREVIGETIVYPNWDDIPFFDTELQLHRGGIWQRKIASETHMSAESSLGEDLLLDTLDDDLPPDAVAPSTSQSTNKPKRNSLESSTASRSVSRNSVLATSRTEHMPGSTELSPSFQTSSSTPPKIMRSNSFATVASPVVTKDDQLVGDVSRHRPKAAAQDAASAMKELSSRAQDNFSLSSSTGTASRSSTPPKSLSSAVDLTDSPELNETSSGIAMGSGAENNDDSRSSTDTSRSARLSGISVEVGSEPSLARSIHMASSKFNTVDKKAAINQSIGSATAAAKKWGLGVLNRQTEWKKQSPSVAARDILREPYGRGQPLPPPGMPLPRPEGNSWSVSALNTLKRKPTSFTPAPPSHSFIGISESVYPQASETYIMSPSDVIEPGHSNRTDIMVADGTGTVEDQKSSLELEREHNALDRHDVGHDSSPAIEPESPSQLSIDDVEVQRMDKPKPSHPPEQI